jgi:hypothetical protein
MHPRTHLPVAPACRRSTLTRLPRAARCAGLNSSAVGLVVTSVFQMTFQVYRSSPFPSATVCIGIFAFGAVDILNLFEPAVVLGGGVLGIIAWAAGCV